MISPLQHTEDTQTLAQAIVNTIPGPFVVLNDRFCVLAASRSFYRTFDVDPEHTKGCLLYALGDGQWDIPALRVLLETIIPQQVAMDDFEVDHDFPNLGRRTMLLNARKVLSDDPANTTILLAFEDVTTRRAIERENAELLEQTEELLRQKHILLHEMQHRVGNSLQIIGNILWLKAQAVTSEEARHHLEDAHERVMSVAEVQSHLHSSDGIDQIDVGTYLSSLCAGLASSMIGESRPITINVTADKGTIESGKAASIGLIVTELVINAIKYAFPTNRHGALIRVAYEIEGRDWRLTVSDNGVGKSAGDSTGTGGGLGTAIISTFSRQLDARLEVVSDAGGMKVSVTRATITSPMPDAA